MNSFIEFGSAVRKRFSCAPLCVVCLLAAVGVALVVEYLAGVIPAIVNQATVSLRLRSLLVAWMGWERKLPTEVQLLIDPQPAWVHLLAVGILVAVLLTAAVVILERRQFPPSDEV